MGRYAQCFQPQSLGIGFAADGDQNLVKYQAHTFTLVLGIEYFVATFHCEAIRLVVQQQLDAVPAQGIGHQLGGIVIFPG